MGHINFKEFELSDKAILEPVLKNFSPLCLSGFTFASLITWSPIYKYKWTLTVGNTLLISTSPNFESNTHLLQPQGNFSPACQNNLLDYCASLDYPLKLFGVSKKFLERTPEFSSHFEFVDDPGLYNYIYLTEDLAFLKGRKFQKKRNLIAQAEKLYTFTQEPVTMDNVMECIQILDDIEKEFPANGDIHLLNEKVVLDVTLRNFEFLKQQGILIRVDGRPVAFSVFEELNPKTAVIHFEKAIRDFKGLYQIINQESAKKIHEQGYEFINREEDLNVEGLRQAKLSYNPVDMCAAYILIYKNKDKLA
jgi:hypothetical protein